MKNFNNMIPDITINKLDKEPFSVVCNELNEWFIIPMMGERSEFALYDTITGKLVCNIEAEATNKAIVHGIQGVEIAADTCLTDGTVKKQWIIAQLSEMRCNFLAYFSLDGDVKTYRTFFDDEVAGFDMDDYGTETQIGTDPLITRDIYGDYTINFSQKRRGIVGRYELNINGRTFDTVCAVTADINDSRVLTEQYIDKNGRTILQRNFTSDSMMMEDGMNIGFKSEHCGPRYTISINGSTHVCNAVYITELTL